MSGPTVDRRPFLKAVAGGAAALTAVGVGARVALHRDGGVGGDWSTSAGPLLSLVADPGSDIATLEVPLGDVLLPATGSHRWESTRLPTTTHSMLAFTWTDAAGSGVPGSGTHAHPHLQVRSHARGTWGAWRRVPLLHDRPDAGSAEAAAATGVIGTDVVWVGAADGVQVRLKGARPADLRLLLLHPARRRTDVLPRTAAPHRSSTTAVVVRPEILDRVAWGADESWRSGTPRINASVDQVHVHHTASTNDYLPEDVPAILRGIYRYHTHTLGWSDIAYNFLVDRYGRIWTGRAGGASKPVRGAHTLGFNGASCGVSVIGNLDLVAPGHETLEAVAAVAAWKLNLYGHDPLGTASVLSDGSDKFRKGTVVTLPVMDGHRDTNDTTCPGGYLYAALPDLRTRAAARILAAQAPVAVVAPATVAGVPALGQTLTATPGSYDPPTSAAAFTWLRDGAPVGSGPTYVVAPGDVGRQVSVRADLTAPGRQGGVDAVSLPSAVTAPAVLVVTTEPKARRAIVRVKVTGPPGVVVPADGQVVVQLGTDGGKVRSRTVTLSGGRGSTRFTHVSTGRHGVKAVYRGAGLLTRAAATTSVTLP